MMRFTFQHTLALVVVALMAMVADVSITETAASHDDARQFCDRVFPGEHASDYVPLKEF